MTFYTFPNLEMTDYRKDSSKLNNGRCMEANLRSAIGSNGYLHLYTSGA